MYATGGCGRGLLLLHGHPRTHTTWHRVAPLLAARFTVVCPDLRGYGDSSKPPRSTRSRAASKRAMARTSLPYAVVGSRSLSRSSVTTAARTSRSAHGPRLSRAVARLVILDAVPIGEALARCDARFAQAWWHWFFYGQPEPPSARSRATRTPGTGRTPRWATRTMRIPRAVHDPATVHAMLEDYRAGLGPDRAARRRRPGRGPYPLGCPRWVVWARGDDMEELCGRPNSHLARLGERRPLHPNQLRTPHGRTSPRRTRPRVTRLPKRSVTERQVTAGSPPPPRDRDERGAWFRPASESLAIVARAPSVSAEKSARRERLPPPTPRARARPADPAGG